jgi:hypothetical protein
LKPTWENSIRKIDMPQTRSDEKSPLSTTQADVELIRTAAMILAGFHHGDLSADLTELANRLTDNQQ